MLKEFRLLTINYLLLATNYLLLKKIMATEYYGINYFPLLTGFFHCDPIELITAIHGVKGPHAVIMLLCKIYTDGYYIHWGEDQCMIFARKLGPEYDKKTVEEIVNLLIEKRFFDKESYEKHGVLTSVEIQKVWLEATSRRKKDLTKLPYMLTEGANSKNVCKTGSSTTENVDKLPTQMELNLENADNFRQSKVKQSKAEKSKELPPSDPPNGEKEEEEDTSLLPPPPEYALNEKTHNYSGLLESLRLHNVKDKTEIKAILRLSDYGRKGTEIWRILAKTNWSRIEAPGKYILKILRTSQ